MGAKILSKNSITGNKILDGIFFILSGIIVGKLIRKVFFRPSSGESSGNLQSSLLSEDEDFQGNNEETENEISTIDRISKA